MSNEARFFFDAAPDALIRNPAVPPAAMGELRWLKEDYAHHAPGARWFYDDIYLCEHPAAGHRIWQYERRTRWLTDLTPRIDAITK